MFDPNYNLIYVTIFFLTADRTALCRGWKVGGSIVRLLVRYYGQNAYEVSMKINVPKPNISLLNILIAKYFHSRIF